MHHPMDSSSLARTAAEAGVSPAFPGAPAQATADGTVFQSHAVRFAVRLAEHLERTELQATPTTEGCYTCLEVLREMLPLLGPLAPVLRNVHDALELCLLSEQHYESGAATDVAADTAAAPAQASPRLLRIQRRSGGGAPSSGHSRVPYFVLVRKLEEAAAALRLERDSGQEEVGRTAGDLVNLEEQLQAAKTQLQGKTSTIEKLMRERAALEAELEDAKRLTHKEEAKYDVLQAECAMLTREFLGGTMKLEEEIDRLRTQQATGMG